MTGSFRSGSDVPALPPPGAAREQLLTHGLAGDCRRISNATAPEVTTAAFDSVIDVALLRAAIVVRARIAPLTSVDVITAPTSLARNVAVADVNVVEPLVLTPSVKRLRASIAKAAFVVV